MHVVSKQDLDSAELETARTSRSSTTVMTANGDVQTREKSNGKRQRIGLARDSYCGRNVDTCDTNANRDLTQNTFLSLKTYRVIQPSTGSRTSLRDQCFFCRVHISLEFCYSLGFGPTGVSGNS